MSETPILEAQLLLAKVLGKPREWVIAHFDEPLSSTEMEALERLLARLSAGEPLAYLTGHQAFYGMDFLVSSDVLIPRPETELLVEEALRWLQDHPERRSALDVGTGSGAIAIVLAKIIPDLKVAAIDISEAALKIARRNCRLHQVEDQITLIPGNLLEEFRGPTDLIIANLPYIPSGTLETLIALRYEPHLALDGGKNGTELISRFLSQSRSALQAGGLVLIEIEATTANRVLRLSANSFPDAKIDLCLDYANLPRIVKIQG